MKYIRKPIVIEAIQWTGENHEEIKEFCGSQIITWNPLTIRTPDGCVRPFFMDYVIYHDEEFGFLKPSDFKIKYKPISGNEAIKFINKLDSYFSNPKAEEMIYKKDVIKALQKVFENNYDIYEVW